MNTKFILPTFYKKTAQFLNQHPCLVLFLVWLTAIILMLLVPHKASGMHAALVPLMGFTGFGNTLLFDKPGDGGGGEAKGEVKVEGKTEAKVEGSTDTPAVKDTTPATPKKEVNSGSDPVLDSMLADAMKATDEASGVEDKVEVKAKVEVEEEATPSAEAKKNTDAEKETAGKGDGMAKVNEGFDPADLVEIGDQKFFYHPDEHGKDTGQGTTYKSRDAAEHGFANKAARIKDQLMKLKDTDLGIGPVDLPEWVESAIDDPDLLDQYSDIDFAIQKPNKELRDFVKQADRTITQLNKRDDQLASKKQTAESKQELDDLTKTAVDNAAMIRNDLAYKEEDLATFNTVDDLKADMQGRIDTKIKADLKEDAEDYQKLLNADADVRMEDDYARKLDRAKEKILDKERSLRTKYTTKYFDGLKALEEAQEKAQQLQQNLTTDKEPTAKALQKQQENAYADLQDYLTNLPYDQQPVWFRAASDAGQNDFWNWAVKRASTFGNLTSSYQFKKAVKAYEDHLSDLRTQVRKQQIEKKAEEAQKTDKEIPKYGRQDELDPNKNKRRPDKQTAMKNELDAMEEMTEEAVAG